MADPPTNKPTDALVPNASPQPVATSKAKPPVSPLVSPNSPMGVSGKTTLTKPTSPTKERIRTDSTSSGTPRTRVDSGASAIKSPLGRLQRQTSKDSRTGIKRSMSRQDSIQSGKRRPSLSIGHADSIPFHLSKPDEIDPKQEITSEIGEEVPWWTSKRLMLSFTCFVGFFFLYSLRVNLSTAIVCMTKDIPSASAEETKTNVFNTTINGTVYTFSNKTSSGDDEKCPMVAKGKQLEGDFDWDKKLQGLILGAFFWGYTFMQIPSGYLSDRFGPRIMVSCGMFPVAILTILSPFLARGSPYLLLVGRIFIGFGEAMMYPGMQSLWAKWSPPHERSRLVGFAFGGSQLGNALTFPFAGLLCAYGFDGGWPSVFYVTGGLGFLWCCVFVWFARDSPGEMPGITEVEKKYIETSLGVYGQTVEERQLQRKRDKPWAKIFTSGAVWAILLANACGNYGAYMLLTQMPTYMKEVLKFDIKSNGAFSMIPYLVFWVFIIGGGQIADLIITKGILNIEWTRKLCCALGTVLPAIFLVLTGYMDCQHQVEAVVLLSLSMGFCGFQFSSFFINHGDIAPKYAGTVFGFTNTGASVPGILAPYIVGAITPNKSREEWLLAFYIAGIVYILGAVLYAFLAKGEVLDWAKEEVEEKKPEEYPLHGITEEHNEHDDETANMVEFKTNGVK